jgi:hypothetical protein
MIEIVEVLALAKLSMLPVSPLVREHAAAVAVFRTVENFGHYLPVHPNSHGRGFSIVDAWDEHPPVSRFPRGEDALEDGRHDDPP